MHLRRLSEIPMPPAMIDKMRESVAGDPAADAAREAIDRLPNGARSAAILFFIEGMKQAEIAEFLEISLAAVKARIRDARAGLQKEMVYMAKRSVRKDEPGEEFSRSLNHRLELARWYREFSEMIDAGITLVRSLLMLSEGNYSQTIRDAAAKVRLSVESGSTLSDALRNEPALQTPEAVALVNVGEVGGMLELSLANLVRCIESRNIQRDIELCTLFRSLGEMLSSGVGILHAFTCAIEVAQEPEIKQAVREIIDSINNYKDADRSVWELPPVTQVLANHPDIFPPMARIATHVGECTGTLDPLLKWLAEERALEIAKRLVPSGMLTEQKIPGGESLDDDITRAYLRDDSPALRAAAIMLLARAEVKSAGPEAVALLADSDAEVRKSAIRAIVDIKFRAGAKSLIDCLDDADASVQREAAKAIAELQLHEAAGAIATAIPSDDLRTNHALISALESMGEIDVLTSRAIEMVKSGKPGMHILMNHPTPAAADVLIAELQRNPTWNTAAIALGRIGRREAVPGLINIVAGPNWSWWVYTAANLLRDLGDPSAAPAIRQAVEEGKLSKEYLKVAEDLEGR